MAPGDPYARVDDYAATFPNYDRHDEAELGRQLLAMSRHIETRCGQQFNKDTTPTTRTYRIEYTDTVLHTAPMAAAPTLLRMDSNGDGLFALTVTGALASRYGDVNGRPLNELYLPPWAAGATQFPSGYLVEVTAIHGWDAVPEQVRLATVHLTALLRLETPRATSSIDELGREVGMSPQGRGIVDDLLAAFKPPQVVV